MIVLLDTGVIGLLAKPSADRHAEIWLVGLVQRGRRVFIPEIADYELRRELLRAKLTASITALDNLLESSCEYLPLDTQSFRRAAELWAELRLSGQPTAPDLSLDGDCLLGAQARMLEAQSNQLVTIATTNEKHLSRIALARFWSDVS